MFKLGVRTLAFALTLLCSIHLNAQQPAPTAGAPAPEVQAPQIQANPALWKIQGPHTTLYLFGTIHLMKPNVAWHTPQVTAAIAASQSLTEEIANIDDTAAAQPLIKQLGTDPTHPLSTKITKDDLALLDTAIKQMGAPGESVLEPLRPWLAGLTLAVLPIIKAGYDPKSGVDPNLAAEFRAKGKPIDGLETIEEQLHFFADMPEAEEVESLHVQLKHLDSSTTNLDKIVDAWTKGDVDAIAEIENGTFLKEYPDLYKRLVVARNKTWTGKLADLLNAPGPDKTIFLAVGAAHLAGPDSVLKMLADRGYTAQRQ